MQFVDAKANWKLYAVIVIGLGLGIADKFQVRVPGFVMWLLGFVGRAGLRDAIRAEAEKSADELVKLVDDILAQVAIQSPQLIDPQKDVTGDLPKPIDMVEVAPLPPVK
jgi:hypothetical protein